MSLLSLFDLASPSHGGRYRRHARPLMSSVLDTLEDQMDQQVGYIFRRLPSVLMENDEFPLRKRRRMERAVEVEPKSKAIVSTKDDKFHIHLDMSSFSPDDITVKVVAETVVVSAKHESKGKDFYEFHEMYRTFDIPEGVDPDAVTSKLSAGGQLTIEAPMKATKDTPGERILSIEREEAPAAKEPSTDQQTQTKRGDEK